MKMAPRRLKTARNSTIVAALLLVGSALFGILLPRPAAAFLSCDPMTLQKAAPDGTTITSATMNASPVAYCDVLGTIATSSEGQNNTVIFELGLPSAWVGDFVLIGQRRLCREPAGRHRRPIHRRGQLWPSRGGDRYRA